MRGFFRHFTGSTVFAVLALSAAAAWGGPAALLTALMLGVLEVSLSFDNAVVNARLLRTLGPFWRRLYLYLGICISVFGMRLLFPLLIVWAVSAQPFGDVVAMTWRDPDRFQDLLTAQQTVVAGFGGAFLCMVFASFFFDQGKDVHWLPGLEPVLMRFGRLGSAPVLLTLAVSYGVSLGVPAEQRLAYLVAAVFGLGLYLLVAGLASLLPGGRSVAAGASGLGTFLFLEVQDASFSFDGVIGAFAITNNLFLITLGLGIGAFFVRSLTVKLVDDGTLGRVRYLEHGAFWAIGALAALLELKAVGVTVPELAAGSVGIVLIALSFVSSALHRRRTS